MSEWWTYSLEDFLLFRPRVYWRLFQLSNEALWPLQITTLALGAAILVLVLRPAPWSGRAIAIALGILWLWVGWSFLWSRYASINWAIAYVAPAFGVQGLLLLLMGARGGLQVSASRSVPWAIGLALYLYALIVHPLTAVVAGRPVQAAEVFGIAPDPTAIATLGIASMTTGRIGWMFMIVPVLWCIVSAVTLYAMAAPEAVIPLTAAGLAIAARVAAWRKVG